MDGVLVLSEKQHFAAWVKILEDHQLPSDWMDFNKWIGISDTVNAEHIINRFKLDVAAHDLHQLKKQTFIELITEGFDSHMGRDTFLETAREHYRCALVSSASKIEIEKIVKHEAIAHHFDFFIGNEDVTHHKPHPMPYLEALKKAQIEPHEALVIEDSHVGIQAALSANIPVIGLKSSAILPNEIKNAVEFFEDFDAISKWLLGLIR